MSDQRIEPEALKVMEASKGSGLKIDSVAVVLFQLGGPDSLESVEPFLYKLFSDPDIIDFPLARLARPTLARLISAHRAKHVRHHYARIGGKSPIREITERQAQALEQELRKTSAARVFVAMRYWHPLTEEAVLRVEAGQFRELVLLPLYPQYSKTTTGSSLNEWHRHYRPRGPRPIPVKIVRDFHAEAGYLDAVVERIDEGLCRFEGARLCSGPGEDRRVETPSCASLTSPFQQSVTARLTSDPPDDVHLVFSAHGVPESVIEAGDPYQAQIETTIRLVVERAAWPNPHWTCYQSRVGPGRWLHPSLEQALCKLATQGAKKVLVVPISFVSDHVETLGELDIEARALARRVGIEQFEVTPALNDSPKFIQALAKLVVRQVGTAV